MPRPLAWIMIGHQQRFRLDQALHLNGDPPQQLNEQLARYDANRGADDANQKALVQEDQRDIAAIEAKTLHEARRLPLRRR